MHTVVPWSPNDGDFKELQSAMAGEEQVFARLPRRKPSALTSTAASVCPKQASCRHSGARETAF